MQQHNLQTKKKMKQEIFFLFNCKMMQQRENADKHKTKKIEIKFWLKAQIAKNQRKDAKKKSRKHRF